MKNTYNIQDRREQRHHLNECGAALLLTLLVMLMLSVLGFSLGITVGTDLTISDNKRSYLLAFHAADSGLEQALADVKADPTWIDAVMDPSTMDLKDPFPSTVSINGGSVSLSFDQAGEVIPNFYSWGEQKSLGDTTFTQEIWFPLEIQNAGSATPTVVLQVRSIREGGEAETSKQSVEAEYHVFVTDGADPGIWEYAIVAGDGEGNEALHDTEGTLEVRGGVRLHGDPDDPPQVQWKGTAAILNHYDGIEQADHLGADASKLPPPPTKMVNGEEVETLLAMIDIEDADIEFLDDGAWGQVDVSGNDDKETIDAVRIDGDMSGDDGAVHSNHTGPFEDDGLEFPKLSDPYIDPDTGTFYATHDGYLQAHCLDLPTDKISSDVDNFDYSDSNGNRIQWEKNVARLRIEGIICRQGDVLIENKNGDSVIEYRGTGTLYAIDKIKIKSDLVPTGAYLQEQGDGNTYNLGLIAGDIVDIAKMANDDYPNVFAAIYAENNLKINDGGYIVGAAIAGFFDFDGQRGGVIHVPLLGRKLPPGMLGGGGAGGGTLAMTGTEMRNWYHRR